SLEIEGALRVARAPRQKSVVIDGSLALYGLRLERASERVDVRAVVRLAAVAGDGVAARTAVDQGALTLGNLRGRITGAYTLAPDGFRVDLAWQTAPRACSQVTQTDPERPDLAALVQDAGEMATLDRAVAAAPTDR